ncbi:MAG: FAD/NAD(P)-binding protein [Brevundimonas sp.]|uniref:FAD/NAD(P)-binding protein n=1 Tax=Brevundimonas sp. TaxID=1871086 RepID=UPI001A29CAF4|nr:FAD/NAD(P)-binding protein [Brevundimonas sp.]MBJ7446332.1 FAD/NAD(P)-binding protein [Brevundimonas sp.]
MTGRHIAIVGGGFSGAMLAARLAEVGMASTVIDRGGDFGLGVAYSTPFDGHLLNVRSNRMSAVEGRPDDFVDWLKAHHPDRAAPESFAPRRLYGLYVQDRLAGIEVAHPGLINRIVGEAVAVEDTAVRLADGRLIEADAVVLATGNPAPKTAALGEVEGRVIGNPWATGALDRVKDEDDVIIVGTGLTMVDMVQWLVARGWRGKATALSRRGLKPRAHEALPDIPVPPTGMLKLAPASRRLAEARRMADESGWRSVMEGLRPVTADLWAAADSELKARFVRHLRPWWDVHRHRIADSIAVSLEALEAEGRLTIVAGRVRRIDQDADRVTLDWRPRRGPEQSPITGQWLIDCTGPGHDPATDVLTGPLIATGRARLDALRLGLDLDAEGRVLDADGVPDDRLLVLGPPARAAFWETIAVPDIRKRIEDLAATLGAMTTEPA